MAEEKSKYSEHEEDEAGAAKPARRSPFKKILLLLSAAILLSGASVGATLYVVGAIPPPFEQLADQAADKAGNKPAKGKNAEKAAKKKKKKKKKKDGKETEQDAQTVFYVPLDPPFVVNLENPEIVRFLQVSMEVMTRKEAVVKAVKQHMPAIRHSLVLLLSRQDYQTLSSYEGKERIRTAALSEIQKILTEHTGKPGVEAVYYTGFVMQ